MHNLSVNGSSFEGSTSFDTDFGAPGLFAPRESSSLLPFESESNVEGGFLQRALYDHGRSHRFALIDASMQDSETRVRPEDLRPVPGSDRVSRAFKEKVIRIAENLGTDPNYLMAIMSFETGGTFSPSIRNAAGSGATGLIQFMPSTARGLGTTTDELSRMSTLEQLDYVERYFQPYRGRLDTVEDAYMAVLYPAAVGRSNDYVLFRRGTIAYRQNSGLDLNGDGLVTKREAATPVSQRLGRTAGPTNNTPTSNNNDGRPYTVRPGDTLSAIAARHGTTWQELARINNLSNPNFIRPGQVLRLR
ncbi:MAG TPA: LysM peptidoglycan-binding domain-containing protein [Pyrinomonadaceae bacterium]|nr:LysM peptidoglycan-binding domain-containing protein [Pyrinomonadaceae bacterium]